MVPSTLDIGDMEDMEVTAAPTAEAKMFLGSCWNMLEESMAGEDGSDTGLELVTAPGRDVLGTCGDTPTLTG